MSQKEFIQDGVIKKKYYGYIFIKVGKKFLPEHKLNMENFIGRYLEPNEVTHHLDFNRSNNKIENLMLFKNQKEHAKFHTKIRQHGITNPIKRQIENRWK